MDPAIELDPETDRGAIKVENVSADRMLPSKLDSVETSVSQGNPKHPLRRRLPLAKIARRNPCARRRIISHGRNLREGAPLSRAR
jgi:hypothetical protein